MNDKLVEELKIAIEELNIEIKEKRKILYSLIEEYQIKSGIIIDEEIERV